MKIPKCLDCGKHVNIKNSIYTGVTWLHRKCALERKEPATFAPRITSIDYAKVEQRVLATSPDYMAECPYCRASYVIGKEDHSRCENSNIHLRYMVDDLTKRLEDLESWRRG